VARHLTVAGAIVKPNSLTAERASKQFCARSFNASFPRSPETCRRAILARLASGEASVTELAGPFDMSMTAVSKHLKVLERAGLIARGKEAQWRPCRLEAGPLKDVADWVGHYRRFWEKSLDRLDDYLREMKKKAKSHVRKQ
jgi:DNA-binding transcriptional ArsR family regulator